MRRVVVSRSKTPVDRAQATALVHDAFGTTARLLSIHELTDGWFNAAYRLDVALGGDGAAAAPARSVVLKVAPPPDVEVLWYEHDILHAEIEALRLVRHCTDAPVPEVLWVDEATRLPSPSFLMSFVPGVSLANHRAEMPPAVLAQLDRTMGRHLAQLHAVTGEGFGLLSPDRPSHDTWPAAFGELVEQLLRDGERAGVVLPVGYDELRHGLAATHAALAEVTVPRFVQWDLWDGNVLVDPVSGALTGYLDFERALWGDPLLEIQFGPHGRVADVVDGYGSDPFTDPGARQRRALYTLYHHLVMSIEGAYRAYPSDPLGDRARAGLANDLRAVHEAGSSPPASPMTSPRPDTACRSCGAPQARMWSTPDGAVRLCPACATLHGVGCP